MNNILVPLGTSPTAHETLQYAVELALDFGANVYIIDVFALSAGAGTLGKVEEKLVKSKRATTKEIIEKVDTRGLDIKLATYNGDIIDGIKQLGKELQIDLIVMAPKSNSVNEALYLGNTSGRIIKQTNIPTLVVPKGTVYGPMKNILVAFKSGVLKRTSVLHPLVAIRNKFNSNIDLLLVKTPGYTEEDLQINTALLDLSKKVTLSENQTTYLGVLEHFRDKQPDLLCVFRRKRGFFKKLWEKNTILKSEFFATVPVLVMSVKKY